MIIFLSGAPSVPTLSEALNFYSEKGFWVFHPRYRGTWESAGSFLEKSPEQDALDIISQLPEGFIELETGKKHKINFKELYLFGSSFGGPAAILASRNKKVTKVILFSPVTDWQAESEAEPMPRVLEYMKNAYGQAYRIADKNWKKLESGNFYNPVKHIKEIDGRKILAFHAENDLSVDVASVKHFCFQIKSELVLLKSGGHFSSSFFSAPSFYKKIQKFLRK